MKALVQFSLVVIAGSIALMIVPIVDQVPMAQYYGLVVINIHRGLPYCGCPSAMGYLETYSMVWCAHWCSLCGMDMCDSACNSNLNQYNIIVEQRNE